MENKTENKENRTPKDDALIVETYAKNPNSSYLPSKELMKLRKELGRTKAAISNRVSKLKKTIAATFKLSDEIVELAKLAESRIQAEDDSIVENKKLAEELDKHCTEIELLIYGNFFAENIEEAREYAKKINLREGKKVIGAVSLSPTQINHSSGWKTYRYKR